MPLLCSWNPPEGPRVKETVAVSVRALCGPPMAAGTTPTPCPCVPSPNPVWCSVDPARVRGVVGWPMLYGARAVMPAGLPRFGHFPQRLLAPCRPVALVLPRSSVWLVTATGSKDDPPSVPQVVPHAARAMFPPHYVE